MYAAIVTGASGQDGSYMCELLTEKGYHVKRLIGDVCNYHNVHRLLIECMCYERVEIYNLAAKIHTDTLRVNTLGILNILEAVKENDTQGKCRIFQASSSEMFGNTQEVPQNENTVCNPRSVYGISKMTGHWLAKNFRENHKLYVSSGILYNHESPRRDDIYVTQKIIKGLKNEKCFSIGNLESKRDWGHAKDYVEAMWLSLQQEKPDDYIIATGKTHSVREFIEMTASKLNKTIEWSNEGIHEVGIIDGEIAVKVSDEFYRPDNNNLLVGDISKIESIGWKRKFDIHSLIESMLKK